MIKEYDFNEEIYSSRANEFTISKCENLDEIATDLKDTLLSLDRPYLCANEIGYDKRIICLKTNEGVEYLCNPIFQKISNHKLVRVTDYQFNTEYIIPVCNDIEVAFQELNGDSKACKLSGESAHIVYEAITGLEGIHPSDIGLEILPEFDEATDEERNELLAEYAKSLVDFYNEVDTELREDESLRPIWNDYRLSQAIANGDIELEEKPAPKLNRKQRRFLDKILKRATKKEKKLC